MTLAAKVKAAVLSFFAPLSSRGKLDPHTENIARLLVCLGWGAGTYSAKQVKGGLQVYGKYGEPLRYYGKAHLKRLLKTPAFRRKWAEVNKGA